MTICIPELFFSPGHFRWVMFAYLMMSFIYMALKKNLLAGIFCLTSLYMLRLIAGHELTGIPYSSWLLMFAFFMFLGLAFLKRCVDYDGKCPLGLFGIGSGFAAALVLAIYVNSPQVLALYRHPLFLL